MKKHSLVQKIDRISNLPSEIRNLIVSFLPFKDAIRTSILSRQWRHICSSLYNMEFDLSDFQRIYQRTDKFRDFVDELMLRHDQSDVRRFSLKTKIDDEFLTSSHVNAWISFVLRHKVQNFSLWKFSEKVEKLPRHFFTCSTITALSLFSIRIEWPNVVEFSMLKSFRLNEICFDDENTINRLISSCTCPVLEDLLIEYCNLSDETLLSISIPSLKSLTLLEGNNTHFNISTPALRKIEYCCSEPPNISSDTLMSLLSADCQIFPGPNSSDHIQHVNKILTGLQNVEKLSLRSNFIESLSSAQDLAAYLPASYCSLKYLLLDIYSIRNHVQVVKLLLRSCPNLQTLCIVIDQGIQETSSLFNMTDMEEYWKLNEMPSADRLNRLRTVEIRFFEGSRSEVHLVSYILQNAKFLENMCFSCTCRKQKCVERELRKRKLLTRFARLAPNLRIVIF